MKTGGLCLLSAGLCTAALGLTFFLMYYRKLKRCTQTVTGEVVRYNYTGSGPRPVVQYLVDGECFWRCKNYRSVIKSTSSWQTQSELWVDEKETLHIRGNMHVMNYGKLIAKLYPPGTKMEVCYNPDAPGESYVKPYVPPYRMAGVILGAVGLFFITISAIIILLA